MEGSGFTAVPAAFPADLPKVAGARRESHISGADACKAMSPRDGMTASGPAAPPTARPPLTATGSDRWASAGSLAAAGLVTTRTSAKPPAGVAVRTRLTPGSAFR